MLLSVDSQFCMAIGSFRAQISLFGDGVTALTSFATQQHIPNTSGQILSLLRKGKFFPFTPPLCENFNG